MLRCAAGFWTWGAVWRCYTSISFLAWKSKMCKAEHLYWNSGLLMPCQLMYRLLHLLDSDQFEKIHRHIHQQKGFWRWWRLFLYKMPVIVKLHLLFLAISNFGPFLKAKWKEIDILKKKNPYALQFLSFFLWLWVWSCCSLLKAFVFWFGWFFHCSVV